MKHVAAFAVVWLLTGNPAVADEPDLHVAARDACSSDVAFYIAYATKTEDAEPASFPNDTLFRYISLTPYIRPADLLAAEPVKAERGYALKITLTPAAVDKINALIERNIRAQDRQEFDALAGLALVVNGRPRDVIQGMLHRLGGNVVYWKNTPGVSAAEAEEAAAAINCRRNSR